MVKSVKSQQCPLMLTFEAPPFSPRTKGFTHKMPLLRKRRSPEAGGESADGRTNGRTSYWDFENIAAKDGDAEGEDRYTENWVFFNREADGESQVQTTTSLTPTLPTALRVQTSSCSSTESQWADASRWDCWRGTSSMRLLLQESEAPARAAGPHPFGRGCAEACQRLNEWAEAALQVEGSSPRTLRPAARIVSATRSFVRQPYSGSRPPRLSAATDRAVPPRVGV